MIAVFLACTGINADDSALDSAELEESGFHGGYVFSTWAEPEPLTAGIQSEFYERVTDSDGHPVEDLQTNHERIIHSIFVSADLQSFQHLHHEDYSDLTVDDIRNATFHFPVTFPSSGEYLAIFDYAHRNEWQHETTTLTVGGEPAQLPSYVEDFSTVVAIDGLSVAVEWESAPVAGFEASFTFIVTEASGSDVTDLVPYLGADAHLAVVSADLGYADHTHAWFPDMGAMSPSMAMPHLYDGPTLPFVFAFPVGGTYKMWLQFARESAPGVTFVAPFMVQVQG